MKTIIFFKQGGIAMKKLGLVGGMGPVSTIDYYQRLVAGFQKKYPAACPPIIIDSLDVFKLLKLEEANQRTQLIKILQASLTNLAAAGAQYAALTANTPHMIFSELAAVSPIPLISILDPVCQAIHQKGQKKVALLGTKMTMELPFYSQKLAAAGIEAVIPQPEQITVIQQIIATELERGIVKPESKQTLLKIIANLTQEYNIEGVILGCTELPLILKQADCQLTIYDTVELHINQLLKQMFN